MRRGTVKASAQGEKGGGGMGPVDRSRRQADGHTRRGTEWTLFRLVVILVVCFFVAMFAVENDYPITLRFLGLQAPGVRLSVLLFAVLLVGGLAALALAAPEIARLRREIRGLRQETQGRGVHKVESAGPPQTIRPLNLAPRRAVDGPLQGSPDGGSSAETGPKGQAN